MSNFHEMVGKTIAAVNDVDEELRIDFTDGTHSLFTVGDNCLGDLEWITDQEIADRKRSSEIISRVAAAQERAKQHSGAIVRGWNSWLHVKGEDPLSQEEKEFMDARSKRS